jgi:hypothetical protein
MIGMFIPLVIRRALVYGPLLLPVLIGTTVACAATAAIVVYMQALREVGLRHAVQNVDPGSLDLRLSFETPDASEGPYRQAVGRVQAEVAQWLGDAAEEAPERYVRSSTFLVSNEGEAPGGLDVAPRSSFHFLSDWTDKFEVVSGRPPRAAAPSAPGQPPRVEALALEAGANALGLEVGQVVRFTPFWEDVTPYTDVVIVGTARIREPQHPDWASPPLSRLAGEPTLLNMLPVLVPEETLSRTLGPAFRKMSASQSWTYDLDPEAISAAEAETARRNIGILEAVLGGAVPSYRQTTELRDLLATYDTRLRFIEVPLAVVLLLVTAMVLYAVIFLATMVVQRQRTDAALMRSRGAHTSHVFVLYAAQGLLISGVAVALGPFLAVAVVSALGYLPAFAALTSGGPLAVSLSRPAFLFSAVGGALSFLVLLVPAFQVARRNPLEERRQTTRPPQAPLLQRYYVDVGLAVVAVLFLWQLGQQGSLVAGAVTGTGASDLFLLLVPTLFLIAAALLLLRLVPLAVRLVARVIAPVAPLWLALGLWQIGRNPLDATRLILLLVLGAGLGAFAASFGGTLERSYRERALYQAGAEVRFVNATLTRTGPSENVQALVEETPGVVGSSLALRQDGSLTTGPPGLRFSLLAVDPETFPAVAWWREDFAGEPLSELLAPLSEDETDAWGLPLPEDARRLGVWVRAAEPSPVSTVLALVMDGNGRYFIVPLGTLESTDWTLIEAPLEPPRTQSGRRENPRLEPAPPFRLLSLQVRQRARAGGMTGGAFFVDAVTTTAADGGQPTTVHQFADGSGWNVLDVGALSRGDSLRSVTGAGREGDEALLFTWGATSGFVQRGIYIGPRESAAPVIVSPGLLRRTGLEVEDSTVLAIGSGRLPVRIVGVAPYFPTLDPERQAGFVIGDVESVVRQQNLVGASGEVQPNEVWTVLGSGLADREATIAEVESIAAATGVVDRPGLLGASQADPLVAAGWGALLFMAYGGVLFLGVVGFIAHAVLTVGERRAQFALLRTLGLGPGQIRAVVWFEHMLVVAVGIAMGYFLGQRTGALLMPFLDRTEAGIAVLPPYILETSWPALGAVYGAMTAVFVLATVVVVRLYNRLALGQALRIGEE